MRRQHIDELEEQLKETRDEIRIKSAAISYPDCIGLIVYHKKYGTGTVEELIDKRMNVYFGEYDIKRFNFPDAFVKGYLQIKNRSIMRKFMQSDQIEKSLIALREREQQLEEELLTIDDRQDKAGE